MEVVYARCCGLDVHKGSISACVLVVEGGKREKQMRRVGTTTAEILELGDWLRQLRVTHVAMESTGVYWKPVWNLLEGSFELLLVNAQHIKQVPGRKTDTKDAEWITDLLQHGLLRSSFVPDQGQRDLRDLTRYRARLSDDCGRVAARVEKVLEDANIKLAAVASDVLGASGRAMLRAMIAGEQDPERLADLAKLRLRQKLPQLRTALAGRVRDHHRFLLQQLLDELEFVEGKLAEVEKRISEQMRPFEKAVTLWKTIPGISDVTAWSLVAEIGVRTEQFASAQHLASWAGMCPGNHESAGKRYSGTTRKGNRWLRRTLNQAAWAVSRCKDSYLAARYRRLVTRRGKKRAIVAIGHKLLVIAYTLLARDCPYRELGSDYFDRLRADGLLHSLVRRIECLGHHVVLQPAGA
jgi:transposase